MNIEVKIDTQKSINSTESSNLEKINRELVMGYNGWQSIMETLNTNKELKKRYDETMREMNECGNCGIASCICSVIDEAFYDLESYEKEELTSTESELLRSENYDLKKKVALLEKKIENLKNILS